jgi:lipid A disaccharide synthetase
MKSKEFFLVAAEESANQYALKLMDTIYSDPRFEGVTFSGIGYENLRKKKFNIIFNAEKLAGMGALEVFSKWRSVK